MLNSEFQFIYFCFITLPIDFFVGCRNSSIEISSINTQLQATVVLAREKTWRFAPIPQTPRRVFRNANARLNIWEIGSWSLDGKSFRKLEYGENKAKDYSILTDVIPLEFLVLGIVNTRSPSSILAVISWGSESIGI